MGTEVAGSNSLPEPCTSMHSKDDLQVLIDQATSSSSGDIDWGKAKLIESARKGFDKHNLPQKPIVILMRDGRRGVLGCDKIDHNGNCRTALPEIQKGKDGKDPEITGWRTDTSQRCRYLLKPFFTEE
ncbi:MAG: hypothetical protein ABII07_02480 [Patescibacteria group bacterium]|nr:hypothetical protein [Patescibacteria group bacterium]